MAEHWDEQTFHNWLNFYGSALVKEIKYQLVFGEYPYAPGYNDGRPVMGTSNKVAGVGFGYSSTLAQSVQAVYRYDDGEVDILMNEYWKWVNQGRKPGGKRPPIEPLRMWAMSNQRLGLNEDEASKAAWGIATNIHRFGIKPTYFFDLAIDNVEKLMEEQRDGLADNINEFLERIRIVDVPPINI